MVLMDFSLGALGDTPEPSEHRNAVDSYYTQLCARQQTAEQRLNLPTPPMRQGELALAP